MYITCQNCDTTFRLDEKLLKPSGSKVRCSQCSHVFVAYPSRATEKAVQPMTGHASASEKTVSPAKKSSSGIDLAELDAILDKGPSFGSAFSDIPGAPSGREKESEQIAAFKESDLDMDFEIDDTGAAGMQQAEQSDGEFIDDLDLGDTFLDEDVAQASGRHGDWENNDNFEDQDLEAEIEALGLNSDGQIDDFGLDELAASIEADEDESGLEELILDDDDAESSFESDQLETGDLGLDEEDVGFLPDDAVSDAEGRSGEIDLDTDGLDLDLDFELDEQETASTSTVEESELNLDDSFLDEVSMEEDIDMDSGEAESSIDGHEAVAAEAPDEDIELSLDDEALKQPASEENSDDSGDFDLSDLDDILVAEEEGSVEVSAESEDEHEPALSSEEDIDLSLDKDLEGLDGELGLDWDEALEESDSEDVADEMGGLDLSDLDDIIVEEDEGAVEVSDEADEDVELSLSSDDEDVGRQSLAEALSGDLELSLDESDQEEIISEVSDDDIDLSDLDDIMVEEDEDAVEVSAGADEDVDLSLSSVEEQKEEPAAELSSPGNDDLDLSDLDDILVDEEQAIGDEQGASTNSFEDAIGEETELSFELDESPLAMDEADESEPMDMVAEEDDDEVIDLTDIEEMLEGGSLISSASESNVDIDAGDTIISDEFDLSEFEAAIDEANSETIDEGSVDEEGELEFDLALNDEEVEPEKLGSEALFDEDEDEDEESFDEFGDETLLEGELELDLDDVEGQNDIDGLDLVLESEEEDGEQFELESDELDLSGLSMESDIESSTSKKLEVVDSGDIRLEFEIEEKFEQEPSVSTTSAPLHSAGRTSDAATELAVDQTIAAPLDSEMKPLRTKPVPRKPKKKTSKVFVIALILIVLAGGGYLGYDYVIKNDIQIPFISDYLNQGPKDPNGILKLSTTDINSKFIKNDSGQLLVITGNVRNGYKDGRNMISLQGKLFTKNQILVKTEKTFAGVTISDQELSSRSVREIKSELKAPPKPKDIDTIVRPGQVLPFMLVFSDLPEDLDQFVIELISSKAVSN